MRLGDGEIGRAIAEGNIADLEHLLDGCDAGDWFLGELANAIRERACQFAVNVDGTAAHAFDDAGVLGLVAVKPSKDEVLARAASAAQNAEDFHLHGFGSRSLKDGPGGAGHAGANLAERKEAGIGRWAETGCGAAEEGEAGAVAE